MRAFCVVILILAFSLFVVRAVNLAEVDDVHPLIQCDAWIFEESEIVWIIPLFQNVSIADNQTWCKQILTLNKTMGMHGVHHTYNEFLTKRDATYLAQGIQAFEQCFGVKPKLFKAPQLALSRENAALLRGLGFEIHGKARQVTHKVYHCEDTGKVGNAVIRLI